ncbi:hypothetical protein Taro_043765 [Colocasia esculenta]|uniref:Uncharacterized protein n=1 Tax=Colocasia esculenta TaxID=4460 RepID=A0A843WS81_COLES|nr:hypothetical protein [Colocasia esculenta]
MKRSLGPSQADQTPFGGPRFAKTAYEDLQCLTFVPGHISSKHNAQTMAGRGRRSAQSRRYEQNRKLKNFVKGLKPSVRAKLLELDSHALEEILGVATKQESRAGPLQEGEATPKEDVTKPFQRQDKEKEKLVESQQSTVTSISEKPECIQCGKRHEGNACWRKEGRCLKYGSKEHRLKECPNLKTKFAPRGASSTTIKEQGVAGDDLGDVTTGTYQPID